MQVVGRFREWVKRTPWARALLAPPYIALLVARQKSQELVQWLRNTRPPVKARLHRHLRPARMLRGRLSTAAERARAVRMRLPVESGQAAQRPALAPNATAATTSMDKRSGARRATTLMRELAYVAAHRMRHAGARGGAVVVRTGALAHRGIAQLPGKMRTNALKFALRHERVALDWAFGRGKRNSPFSRLAGHAALRGADLYYRREFGRIQQGAPVLEPGAFDPERILLVIGSLGPGGAERQVVATLLGLRKAGWTRISLICTFLQEPWQRFFLGQLQEAGIDVHELAKGTSAAPDELEAAARTRFDCALASLPPLLGDIRDYAAEFVRRRPGVVHLWLDEINCKAGLAALAVGVPRIVMSARSVSPHHFGLYHQYMAEAYRLLLRSPRVTFLNNSAAGAVDYARWLKLPPERVKVVHNGFDFADLPPATRRLERGTAFRGARGWSAGTPVLGTILRFTEEKRPDLWVDTAIQLAAARPALRFLLVGDGPMRPVLEDRVAALGIADRFWFVGYQQDTVAALCAMDVFLLTSRKEGLPNVLVEAQALGVPVVSTDAGGAQETFLPSESGVLVPADSAAALAAAVLAVFDDPGGMAAMGVRARAQANDRFGIQRMVWETLAAYGVPARPQRAVEEIETSCVK